MTQRLAQRSQRIPLFRFEYSAASLISRCNQIRVLCLLRYSVGLLEKVLRPAVKTYLDNDELKPTAIQLLYNDALKIDGLLEVVQFLKKIEPMV